MENKLINILLVDDSTTNNLLLESALRHMNFQITTATSGEEALKFMRKKKYSLVFLDVMMPGLSGYEVLAKMNEEKLIENTSVIMVTARSKTEEEKKALEMGAIVYYEKPLDLPTLIENVRELSK